MKRLFTILMLSIPVLVFTRCSRQYGKEYKLDKLHSIFYKGEGVDEALAKKLANYLKEQDYFRDSVAAAVQLLKVRDTFNLNFVVDANKISSRSETNLLIFGAFISETVFNKAPVVIQLADNRLEPFKNLGYAKPVSDSSK